MIYSTILYFIVEMFGLQGPESYAYTSRSNCLDVPGIDDSKDFRDTLVRISLPAARMAG
jgi:myosin heavy subunit